ncbi:MAG TPA: DMT family transporter [Bacteroidia bacterium]|nr:DMT family transporter [Bacteroidia bacterium]HRS57855.1 DMT family transporter [Bacteroidia bacterium]HRU67805.1 DMT family transporter [Bacteroidia bacterium]
MTGEVFALLTAICWTITALAFEAASKRVGSLTVNIIRLVFAFVFLSVLTFLLYGKFLPTDARLHQWIWLSLSGLIGFVLGDYFLFKSYTFISSRISMLVMTMVPPVTALFGFIFLHETMNFKEISGMLLVVSGIGVTVLSRNTDGNGFRFKHSSKGIFYAFLGALGQAFGLILSKYGMQDYNAFASTQIRTMTGIVGFAIVVTGMKKWGMVFETFTIRPAMKNILFGSVFGPFLGVSFSLLAVQHTQTGIASTIMALVPVLIIIPLIIIYKQKISLKEIAGAVISVLGTSLLFL